MEESVFRSGDSPVEQYEYVSKLTKIAANFSVHDMHTEGKKMVDLITVNLDLTFG